jgi:hypothetical protein
VGGYACRHGNLFGPARAAAAVAELCSALAARAPEWTRRVRRLPGAGHASCLTANVPVPASAPLDTAGQLLGGLVAPFTAVLSALRQSRMFHPRGITCAARVMAEPARPELAGVAEALAGVALVRWSSALWKHGEHTDVLGCALRFTTPPLTIEPKPGDQDLLLATIQRPWTMPLSPFSTRTHDFLANVYFGVSPFEVAPLGRVEWRVAPLAPSPAGADRRERLGLAALSRARLSLELAPYTGPWRRPDPARFARVAVIELTSELALDQEALRFDPFRSGRGLEPVGFVHALRRATYAASQRGRPRAALDRG